MFALAIAASSLAADTDEDWLALQAEATVLMPRAAQAPLWEWPLSAVSADVLVPMGGQLLVGHLGLTAEGAPLPGRIELWERDTGRVVWALPRPWTEGIVWQVLTTDPVVVLVGKAPRATILIGIEAATGRELWTAQSGHDRIAQLGTSAIVLWREGALESLSVETGETNWSLALDPPTALHPGKSLLVETTSAVLSVDPAWGAEAWRVEGGFTARPADDGWGTVLYDSAEVRFVDGYGQTQWIWTPPARVASLVATEGRALVITSEAEADRLSVVDLAGVVASMSLDGRSASKLTPVHGVFAVSTEDEVIAVASDGTTAFRSPIPDRLLGWGPADRPDLAHGQPDTLTIDSDLLLLVRERAGIAAYSAANFDAGRLAWSQAHAVMGADARSAGGRFSDLAAAMTQGEGIDGAIARRRMELDAAFRRAAQPIRDNYYIRPFHHRGMSAEGVTLVELTTGQRADILYAPMLPSLQSLGVDLPPVTVDVANRQLIVVDAPVDPAIWRQTTLGTKTGPSPTVRAYSLDRLAFGVDSRLPEPIAEDPTVAPVIDASDPDALLAAHDGPSWDTCLQLGIVNEARPDVLEACLAAGIPLIYPGIDDQIPLLMAAHANQVETVRLLLDAGAEVNMSRQRDPRRAIELATDASVVALLVERGGIWRTKSEKLDDIKALLALADLRKPNAEWCFHHAGRGGRSDVLEYCLGQRRVGLVTYVDPDAGHVIHLAAIDGRSEDVRALLQHGVDPKVRDAQGRTALDHLEALEAKNDGQAKASRLLQLAGG